MVTFYENGERSPLEEALDELRKISNRSLAAVGMYDFRELETAVFDRSNYEGSVKPDPGREKGDLPPSPALPVLSVLKRLALNAAFLADPRSDPVPQSGDQSLQQKLRQVGEQSMGGSVSEKTLGETVDQMNRMLIDMMQREQVGIDPRTVGAIAWLSRRCFELLRSLTYERASGARRQAWFHSILLFQELTGSTRDFNQGEFEEFLQTLQRAGSPELALQLVGQRTASHVDSLTRRLSLVTGQKSLIGGLLDANVAAGLTFDPLTTLPTESLIGERYRQEALREAAERLTSYDAQTGKPVKKE